MSKQRLLEISKEMRQVNELLHQHESPGHWEWTSVLKYDLEFNGRPGTWGEVKSKSPKTELARFGVLVEEVAALLPGDGEPHEKFYDALAEYALKNEHASVRETHTGINSHLVDRKLRSGKTISYMKKDTRPRRRVCIELFGIVEMGANFVQLLSVRHPADESAGIPPEVQAHFQNIDQALHKVMDNIKGRAQNARVDVAEFSTQHSPVLSTVGEKSGWITIEDLVISNDFRVVHRGDDAYQFTSEQAPVIEVFKNSYPLELHFRTILSKAGRSARNFNQVFRNNKPAFDSIIERVKPGFYKLKAKAG
jgi:hypothetical protein